MQFYLLYILFVDGTQHETFEFEIENDLGYNRVFLQQYLIFQNALLFVQQNHAMEKEEILPNNN